MKKVGYRHRFRPSKIMSGIDKHAYYIGGQIIFAKSSREAFKIYMQGEKR